MTRLSLAVAVALPAALVAVFACGVRKVDACPSCSPTAKTLSEQMAESDFAVIIKLTHRPPEQPADAPIEASYSTFEVVETLKGEQHLAGLLGANKPYQIKILFFDDVPLGTKLRTFGFARPDLVWATPTALGDAALDYVRKLPKLPPVNARRLVFFQDYFEHADKNVAADAYNEFAVAPYSDLVAIKADMPREKLLRWIGDKNVSTSTRRLYLCMLSVCGKPEDAVLLEKLIRIDDRHARSAIDAMIGAYLTIKGAEGLPLIEDLFLKNQKAEFTDTYAAIMALRFIGTETKVIPQTRLMEAMRHILARPQLADVVIPDLTRWQDWSVMPRMVELFKTADDQSAWVRIPVVNYLRACPLPEAKVRLEELAKIDPEAIKRANHLVPQAAIPPEGALRPSE